MAIVAAVRWLNALLFGSPVLVAGIQGAVASVTDEVSIEPVAAAAPLPLPPPAAPPANYDPYPGASLQQ